MATHYNSGSNETRPWTSSPRSRGRENTKNTQCRNITAYGYCRDEHNGCMYDHTASKANNNNRNQPEGLNKRLNVDSPSFTPAQVSDGVSSGPNTKNAGISPKMAVAAPFTPKASKASKVGMVTPPSISRNRSSEWTSNGIPEFVPQGFHQEQQLSEMSGMSVSDPFNPYDGNSSYSEIDSTPSHPHVNPYAHDTATSGAAPFFQQTNAFAQPLQYHLYAPIGPQRDNLLTYQKTAHDFFLSESLRQDLQRKAEATLQVLPNSNLPASIEHFHSLVPLDLSHSKAITPFGYKSWVYKAMSSKDGHHYALRRLEDFRLTSEKGIEYARAWKSLTSGSTVTLHDYFTTRVFGDSSMIFVTDYCPLAKTLHEHHFSHTSFARSRNAGVIPEQSIWSYIVQLTSALKTIHTSGLAARLITPSKILVTDKNRIRLNVCGILDVVQAGDATPLHEHQQTDLYQLGCLGLSLATNNPNAASTSENLAKSVEAIPRSYSDRLRNTIITLLNTCTSAADPCTTDIITFASSISDAVLSSLDANLLAFDATTSELSRELENGRLVRLLAKLGCVNERPEYNADAMASARATAAGAPGGPFAGQHNPTAAAAAAVTSNSWSETGERYYLKLFRDYVFHQVSPEDGRPVVDLGHILACLNKLDAGSDEKVTLMTRDEQNVFVVSFREVKRGLESAFGDLLRSAGPGASSGGSGPGAQSMGRM